MPWNEDGTVYTPPGGWSADNKAKAKEALKRPTRPTLYDGPTQTQTQTQAPTYKPLANADVFSKALQQQPWSPSTYAPPTTAPTTAPTAAPTTTASPFSNADVFSKALQQNYKPSKPSVGILPNEVTPVTTAPPISPTANGLIPSPTPVTDNGIDPKFQGQGLSAYDPTKSEKPPQSVWDKAKSVFSTIFTPLSDTAKDNYRDLANTDAAKKLTTGINDVANSAPIKYLNQQNEKVMDAVGQGAENTLTSIGKASAVAKKAIAPYKGIPGARTLDTMLTAGEVLGGFSQTDLQNKDLPQEFGAGFRRGLSGLRNTVGEIAKWKGLDQFGNDQIALGNADQAGFNTTPGHEFKGWQSFLDPHFLASGTGETLPSTLALLPLGLAGGALGGTVAAAAKMGKFASIVMQGIGAGALSAPMEAAMEAGQSYNDVRTDFKKAEEKRKAASIGTLDSLSHSGENFAKYTEEAKKRDLENQKFAKKAADETWLKNVALLTATNSLEFGSIFMPKGVSKALDSLPGKLATNAVMEGGEEGAQQWIQNSSQGKPTSLSDPAMQESIGLGALMGMGFGLAGHSHESDLDHQPTITKAEQAIQNIKDQVIASLSDEDKNDLNIHIADAKKQGMTEEEAFNHALEMLAGHPDGAKLIEKATQNVVENEQVRLQALQPAAGPADFTTGASVYLNGRGHELFTVGYSSGNDSKDKKVRVVNAKGETMIISRSQVFGSPIAANPEAQAVSDQATQDHTTDEAALVDAPEKGMQEEQSTPAASQAAPAPTSPTSPTAPQETAKTVPPHTPTDQIDFSKGAKVHLRGPMYGRPFTVTGSSNTQVHLEAPQGGALTVNKKGVHSNYIDPNAVQETAPQTTAKKADLTKEEAEAEYKKMREDFVTSKISTPKNKIKAIEAMKQFTSDHGIEFHERWQTLLDGFKSEVAAEEKAKQEADQREAKNKQDKEDFTKKHDTLIQNMVDIAATHPHIKSFMADHTIERGKDYLTLNGEGFRPSNYEHTPESYLRKLYGQAREQIAKSEGRKNYFQVGDKGVLHFGNGQSNVIITEVHNDGDVKYKHYLSGPAGVGKEMLTSANNIERNESIDLSLSIDRKNENFDNKVALRNRLNELSLEQLKTIVSQNKITVGKTKLKDSIPAYANFITEALTRNDRVPYKQKEGQTFDKMLVTLENKLTPDQYNPIKEQLDGFMTEENDKRIDEILFDPTVKNVAVNYTDLADGSRKMNYILYPDGSKENDYDYGGTVPKKTFKVELATLEWNTDRQPMIGSEPDYTGFTHKAGVKARHAEKLREGLERAKEANRQKKKAEDAEQLKQNIQDAYDGIKEIDDQLADLEKEYQQEISNQYDFLKKSRDERDGIIQGNMTFDEDGNVIDRTGRKSKNPEWFQKFFKEHGHTPTNKELQVLAKEHIDNGFTDNGMKIPSWTEESGYNEKKDTLNKVKDDITQSIEELTKTQSKAEMTNQAKRSIEHFYHFWSESWTDEKIAERVASENNLDVADVLAYARQYRAEHGIPDPSKTEIMKAWNDKYRAELNRKNLEELRAMSNDDLWTEYFKKERFSTKVQGTTKQEITAWFKSTAGIWGGSSFGDYGSSEHSGSKGWSLKLDDGRVLKKTHAQMADLYMEDQSRVAKVGIKGQAFENLHFVTYDNPDEMAAVNLAKAKAILVSYAGWEGHGKIADFVDGLAKKPIVIVDNGAYSKKPMDTGMWDVMEFFTNELDETPEGAWNQMQNAIHNETYEDGEASLREQFPAFYDYMDWLDSNESAIDYIIPPDNLDGTAEERQAKSMYAYRFFKAGNFNLIPVYTYNAPLSMIDDLIKEGADYIAIGGTVKNPDLVKDSARAAYAKNIVEKYPNIKFHLLGTNDQWLIDHIPGLYSADGSTWQSASMHGKTGQDRVDAGVDEIKKREETAYGKREAFADLLHVDFSNGDWNEFLTDKQIATLEDAQDGKLFSNVPYAIFDVLQDDTPKSRVGVRFLVEAPTERGFVVVSRIIEPDGSISSIEDSEETMFMNPFYTNDAATRLIKSTDPKTKKTTEKPDPTDYNTFVKGDRVHVPESGYFTFVRKKGDELIMTDDNGDENHFNVDDFDFKKVPDKTGVTAPTSTDKNKTSASRTKADGEQDRNSITIQEEGKPDFVVKRNDYVAYQFSTDPLSMEKVYNAGRVVGISHAENKVNFSTPYKTSWVNIEHIYPVTKVVTKAQLAAAKDWLEQNNYNGTYNLKDVYWNHSTQSIYIDLVLAATETKRNQVKANLYVSFTGNEVELRKTNFDKGGTIRLGDAETLLQGETDHGTASQNNVRPLDEQQSSTSTESRTQKIANELKVLISKGTEVKSGDLFRIADTVYKGTQSEGRYTPKDAYDAMELAVNQYLLEQHEIDLTVRDPATVKKNVAKLFALVSKLPTQTKRTEGQELYQQFSTPPAIAYVASWVANITHNDVVLEPSAGIGGMALFAKANDAEVIVNELDPRRLDIIKQMPFDKFFMEDGEQINNILPESIKPTVVIMNPPFSTSATRGITDTNNSFNHVEQALKRLEPKGRLVAVLGQGREGNSKGFTEWIAKLQKSGYTVRAAVAMDGKNYVKYGTSFNVQIVVIDKTSFNMPVLQAAIKPLIAKVSTLDEVVDLIGGIANDRQAAASRDRGSEQNADQSTGASNTDSNSTAGQNTGGSGIRDSSSSTSTVGDHGSQHSNRVDESRPNVQPTDEVRGSTNSTGHDEGTDGVRGRTDHGQNDVSGNTGTDNGKPTGSVDQQEDGSRGNPNETGPVKELTDAIFEDYVPSKLNIKNAQKHPGQLSESAAMAAIDLPDLKYKLKLPANLIEDGKLSSAQLEVVAYAGQAHSQMLRDGKTRKGLFVGDGTGLGKGREMVGIIMDNFAQGRTKAVWVSENKGLLPSARRDWKALDGESKEIFGVPKLAESIPHKRGVLFTTYNTVASGMNDTSGKNKQSRMAQMVAWLGKDFDGVIIFDEAHNMANALDSRGARGVKKASQRALAGVELQRALPNARIVYASATGATEVSNLAYTDRLGLWGTGTAFANVMDFINKITAGGIAAMELVARDMKAMGLYIARNLSYNGVEYQKITHNLTTEQTETYDVLAHSWQIVLQNINAALEAIGVTKDGKTLDGKAKGAAIGQFWGAQQRFFNQVLTAMQMPSVLAEAKKDLAAGKSIVMQLVNTNAASQDRQVKKVEEEEGDLEDLDLTPREIIQKFLDSSFPIQQFEEYVDDNGNKKSRPVFDSQGNPVINREAEAMKFALMERLSGVAVPEGPLEMVLNTFGTDAVAEITGRKQRVVYKMNNNTGRMEKILEKRTDAAVEADSEAFMNGPKRILMFSNAGGTGRSYHADRTVKNQQQRMHYLVQAGWEATKAVQGFGRTHRTNQASAPVYKLFTTNLRGQMRFVSSIARRLDQLGALTKGQRETGSQGLFSAADNLEGNLATHALEQFYTQLIRGGFPTLNARDVLTKMGLFDKLIVADTSRVNDQAPELREVTKFLNRILTLESAMQNEVFDTFQAIIVHMTEIALQDGTLDTGLENIKADTAKLVEEVEINRNAETNSVTTYNKIELGHKTVKVPLKRLMDDEDFVGIYRNEKSKAVVAVLERGARTLEDGSIVKNYQLQGPESYDYKYMNEKDLKKSKWKQLQSRKELKTELADLADKLQATGEWTKDEANAKAIDELMPMEDVWEKALKDVPKYRNETLHMISGTLLPIWDRLPTEGVRVVRARMDDGKTLLGRVIPQNAINNTLYKLGAERRGEDIDTSRLADKILDEGYSVILVNGWKFAKRRVSNQSRIEITGPTLYKHSDEFRQLGVFAERIAYDTRYFVPTGERGNAVIQEIVKNRPIAELIPPRSASAPNVNSSEEDDDGASLAAPAAGKTKKPKKKKSFAPVSRLIEETKRVITPRTAEKLSNMLATFLGTTVYKGHVKRGAQGTYYSGSGATAVTEEAYGEWRVVGHELGHAFSDFYRFDDDNKLSGSFQNKELREMAQELYPDPSKLHNMTAKEIVEEGFAEFFRQWVTDPVLAHANAPTTFGMFTDFIASDPKLAKIMNTVRGMVDDDFSGDVFERTSNGIISTEASEDVNYGERDILGYQRAAFNLIDFTLPAKRIMDHLRSQGIQMKVDLAKLLALTGNAMSKAKLTFTSRPTDSKGAFIGDKRSLQTIFQDAVDSIGNKIGWQTVQLKTIEKNYGVYKQFKTLRAHNFFEAVLLANRVKERYSEGHRKLPMSLDMANEILQIAEARFPEVWNPNAKKGKRGLAEEFVETFSYVVLEKLERAGIINATTRAIVEERSHFYIPMITDKKMSQKFNGTKGSGRTTHNPVGYFKGSVTPVLGAYNAVLIKLTEVESAIEHKRAFDALHDALKEDNMGAFGRVRITIPPNVTVLDPADVLAKMRDDVLEILADHGDLNDVFKDNSLKFFTPGGLSKIDPNKPIIMNIRNGHAVYIELHPDVYRMMLAMQPVMVSGLAKGLAFTSRLTRHVALSSIVYLPNAASRDVGTALIQSKAPLHTLTTNLVRSVGAITGWGKHGEAMYNSFISSGAFNSAAENMITSQLKHINKESLIRTTAPGWFKTNTKTGRKLFVRVLSSPVAIPHQILKFNEELPRISEFVSMMKEDFAAFVDKQNKSDPTYQNDEEFAAYVEEQQQNDPTYEPDAKNLWELYLKEGTDALPMALQKAMEGILVNAGYAASEITTNFNLHGANEFVRKYAPTVAFLHGTMQGFYRTARQFKDHPYKTASITLLGYGLLAYLAWMLMNSDKDDKKVLQDMDSMARDKYLWFPSGVKGIYVAIAKPYEYAIPMNMMERFFDHASGDPQARGTFSDMASLFSGLTGVNGINSVLQTAIDMYSNKASNGGSIVPMGEEKDAKYMQAGPDTSLTARTVAKLFADITGDPQKGFSPRMMDYFLKQNFGKLAGGLLSASDFAIKFGQTGSVDKAWQATKPTTGIEYFPFIGQVIRSQAEGNSRIVEDFYNQYNEVQTFSATAASLITKITDMSAKNQLVLPSVPSKMLTSESILRLQYLPAMDYIAGEMNATRKQYAQAIVDAPNADVRRVLTLQKDYVEKLQAGLLFGFDPAMPHPDAGITPVKSDALKSYYLANAQQKMVAEQKKKGGVTDQVIYLTNMANMVK